MSGGRVERALIDLVGGADGGVTLWALACGKLERVGAAHRDGYGFRSYPRGALDRLRVELADVLRVAELAADVQDVIDDDPLAPEERAGDIADLLIGRARALGQARQGFGVGR